MSLMALKYCSLEPVTSDAFISSLRDLVTLLKSCIGPKGMPKLLVTSGNYIDLTSYSHTLGDRLDLQNPICRYILQAMKAQPDFGLYMGVFISSTLEQVWTMQSNDQYSTSSIIEAVEHLVENCNNLFSSAKFALKIDFNSVKILVYIAKNVLLSKQFLFLSAKFVENLSLNIVKAFLISIDNNDFKFSRVSIRTEQGSDESHCYSGILYQIVENDEQLLLYNIKRYQSVTCGYHILLFSIILINDEKNEENTVVNTTLRILQSAVELGIHIVACQKVVHDSIKLFLRRNGVLLLERMGTELTNTVKEISNAMTISDLSQITDEDIGKMKGYLTSIDFIKFNKKKYLLLENSKRTVTTLVISTSSLARENEVKIVIEQALDTLRSIAKDPRLVPGAGCFEVWLFIHFQLQQVSQDLKNKVDKFILSAFQKAIISSSGLQFPLSYDTVYHHAWTSEDLDWSKCNCGLITKSVVTSEKGDWIPLNKYGITIFPNQIHNISLENLSQLDGVIMDSFLLKKNALISALEICVHLLSTGLVVYKNN